MTGVFPKYVVQYFLTKPSYICLTLKCVFDTFKFCFCSQGLKSSLADYKAATYMIVCQLAVKITMVESLVNSLTIQISKTLTQTPSLIKEGLGCLIVLLQNQKEESLGER